MERESAVVHFFAVIVLRWVNTSELRKFYIYRGDLFYESREKTLTFLFAGRSDDWNVYMKLPSMAFFCPRETCGWLLRWSRSFLEVLCILSFFEPRNWAKESDGFFFLRRTRPSIFDAAASSSWRKFIRRVFRSRLEALCNCLVENYASVNLGFSYYIAHLVKLAHLIRRQVPSESLDTLVRRVNM